MADTLRRAEEPSSTTINLWWPNDTRVVRLALTAEGVAVVDRAVAVVHDLLEELTAPLGGTTGNRTRALMRDLHALLAVPNPPTDRSQPRPPHRIPPPPRPRARR